MHNVCVWDGIRFVLFSCHLRFILQTDIVIFGLFFRFFACSGNVFRHYFLSQSMHFELCTWHLKHCLIWSIAMIKVNVMWSWPFERHKKASEQNRMALCAWYDFCATNIRRYSWRAPMLISMPLQSQKYELCDCAGKQQDIPLWIGVKHNFNVYYATITNFSRSSHDKNDDWWTDLHFNGRRNEKKVQIDAGAKTPLFQMLNTVFSITGTSRNRLQLSHTIFAVFVSHSVCDSLVHNLVLRYQLGLSMC